MSEGVPEGYVLSPNGVACRCVGSWRDAQGRPYCRNCTPDDDRPSVATLVTTRSDAELAAEFKERIAAATQKTIDIMNEAQRAGFVTTVNVAVSQGVGGQTYFLQLCRMEKHY